jgi:hypothetical protein
MSKSRNNAITRTLLPEELESPRLSDAKKTRSRTSALLGNFPSTDSKEEGSQKHELTDLEAALCFEFP